MRVVKLGVAVLAHQDALLVLGHHGFQRAVGQGSHVQLEFFVVRTAVVKGDGCQVLFTSADRTAPAGETHQLELPCTTPPLLGFIALQALILAGGGGEPFSACRKAAARRRYRRVVVPP